MGGPWEGKRERMRKMDPEGANARMLSGVKANEG